MNGTKQIALKHFSTQRKIFKFCLLTSDAVFSSSRVFYQEKAEMLIADG